MSVGGRVVEVVKVSDAKVWVNTDENAARKHGKSPHLCAIYVNPMGFDIQPGDSLWWQGRSAYWTPKQGNPSGAFDIELPRIGFSGVSRPTLKEGGSR